MEFTPEKTHPRILQSILKRLYRQFPDLPGFLLTDATGEVIYKFGNSKPPYVKIPFLANRPLLVPGMQGALPPELKPAIQGAADLYSILSSSQSDGDETDGVLGHFQGSGLMNPLLGLSRDRAIGWLRAERLEKIMRLRDDILRAENLGGALDAVISMARQTLSGRGASLLLLDPRTAELIFYVVAGEDRNRLDEVRIPAGRGIAGSVASSGVAELINDAPADPRFYSDVDRSLGKTTRNMVVAPIFADERIVGVLEVINSTDPVGFSLDDLDLLSAIAAHTGLLLENVKKTDDLQRSRHELDVRLIETQAMHSIVRLSRPGGPRSTARTREILRILLVQLGYESGIIMDVTGDDGSSLQERERIYSDGSSSGADRTFADCSDTLVWLKENREPLSFRMETEEREAAGILRRLLEAEPELAEGTEHRIWIPVFNREGSKVIRVLSLDRLSGTSNRLPHLQGFFFESVIELLQADDLTSPLEVKAPPVSARAIKGALLACRVPGLTVLEDTLDPFRFQSMVEVIHGIVRSMIERNGGTLHQFFGDLFLGSFESREADQPELRALHAAIEIKKELSIRDIRRAADGSIFRSLIHSGHGFPITSLGSFDNMSGKDIRTVTHLCQTMEYGNSGILLTERGFRNLPGHRDDIRDMGPVPELPDARLFEVVEDPDSWKRFRDQWNMALQEIRDNKLDRATLLLQGMQNSRPGDNMIEYHLKRCQAP